MKKYLLAICGLAMIAAFTSCGDSNEDSSKSVPTNVIEATTTEITTVTTPTIQEATEESYKNEELTLNSELECDYLKISTCSAWKEQSKMEEETFNAFWDWGDADEGPYYFISLELIKTSLGKMSQSDLQEYYEDYFKYFEENIEENKHYILDSFVKKEQAYIILGTDTDTLRMIHFSTDTIEGHFIYSSECEDIVMDMIDSIEFK